MVYVVVTVISKPFFKSTQKKKKKTDAGVCIVASQWVEDKHESASALPAYFFLARRQSHNNFHCQFFFKLRHPSRSRADTTFSSRKP